MLKESSRRLAKRLSGRKSQGKKRQVFFLSLVAADRQGRHRNEFFAFDVMTKMDMQNTEVVVLDVHDLVDSYKKNHHGNLPSNITVYELVEDFIDHHPDDSFFIDECPILGNDKYGFGYSK